jgi:hypothetical protein
MVRVEWHADLAPGTVLRSKQSGQCVRVEKLYSGYGTNTHYVINRLNPNGSTIDTWFGVSIPKDRWEILPPEEPTKGAGPRNP